MSSSIKILKERIERLTDLESANITRMKLIIDKAINEINLMIEDEMKNFDDVETKIMMEEKWMTIKKLWKNLEEFEINILETKINAEM